METTVADVVDVEAQETPQAKPLAVQQQRATAISTTTPADLLRYALDSGADLDRLERLMELQQRWEANEARKAFVKAMAEFKKNPPTIYKDKHVEFRTDKGVTAYDHATIGNVVEKVVAALAEHGFSHRWIPKRAEGGMMKITCVITHELGYSEETELEAGLDQSGGKNNIQAMISTKSYLERHSLLAATGLATKDTPDDDGRSAEDPPEGAQQRNTERAAARAEKQTEAPAFYDQKKFDLNKGQWREMIVSGKKTVAQITKVIESKGAPLTEEQKLTLDAYSHEKD